MNQKKIELLLIEDNSDFRYLYESFFSDIENVDIKDFAENGQEALLKLANNTYDVVLLDLVMPKMDGIAVLERIGKAKTKNKPYIIVTSCNFREQIIRYALDNGADYYMIKPFDMQDLLNRIYMISSCYGYEADGAENRKKKISGTASKYLIEMGAGTNTLGYKYSIDAVCHLVRENIASPIVKEVYAKVAKQNDTSPECVETAIRKMIKRLYENHYENISSFMNKKDGECKKPSNGELLTMLAVKIDME